MLCEIRTTARPRSARRRTSASTWAVWATPEGGGGLVEDDDLGVPEHGLGDGDGLALATGQAGDPLADRLHGAHRQRLERLLARPAPCCSRRGRCRGALAAEEHVLDDVEVVAQREVLVDDLDAQRAGVARRVHGDRAALEEVVAGVDRVRAADALDERGLAGAVVADQGGDLARVGGEVDVLEHVDGAEALVDAAQSPGSGTSAMAATLLRAKGARAGQRGRARGDRRRRRTAATPGLVRRVGRTRRSAGRRPWCTWPRRRRCRRVLFGVYWSLIGRATLALVIATGVARIDGTFFLVCGSWIVTPLVSGT